MFDGQAAKQAGNEPAAYRLHFKQAADHVLQTAFFSASHRSLQMQAGNAS